jgi:hypothetical protein
MFMKQTNRRGYCMKEVLTGFTIALLSALVTSATSYARGSGTNAAVRTGLRAEKLQNVISSSSTAEAALTTVYVSPTGNDITGTGSPGSPFKTIQKGINAVAAGGSVMVAGGMYVEDLSIPLAKASLEIAGAGTSSTTVKGVQSIPVGSFPLTMPNIQVLGNGVRIHGFTIEGPDYVSGKYSSGLVINASNVEIYGNNFRVPPAGSAAEVSRAIQTIRVNTDPTVDISGLNIHDNVFTHIATSLSGYEGIWISLDAGTGTATVQNNQFGGCVLRAITTERSRTTIYANSIITDLVPNVPGAGAWQGLNTGGANDGSVARVLITANTIKGSGAGKGFKMGIELGYAATSTFDSVSVNNNFINANDTGVVVRYGANGIVINGNNISGNNYQAVQNDDPSHVLDASSNWWNSYTPRDVVSANVDFTPFIIYDGSDTDPGTPGFQGNFTNVEVSIASPQVGSLSRIQEGIGWVVLSGYVHVGPGVYQENIVINKSLALIGDAGFDSTTIDGGSLGDCIAINSELVRVKGFTLTNGVNGISGVATNSELRYLDITGNNGCGIRLVNSDYNVIHTNRIRAHTGASSFGVYLSSSRYNTVTGNQFYGNTINVGTGNDAGRAAAGNMIVGNTLVAPAVWSVQVSSGAPTTRINFNVFNDSLSTPRPAGTKYINNTDNTGTLDAQYNWFGGAVSPGSGSPRFNGSVNTSNNYSTSIVVGVAPATDTIPLVTGGNFWVPVVALVPAGTSVQSSSVTIAWDHVAIDIGDRYRSSFFYAGSAVGHPPDLNFDPTSSVSTNPMRLDESMPVGTTGGAGNPANGIPYVGALAILNVHAIAVGTDAVVLSNVLLKDPNGVNIAPLTIQGPGHVTVQSNIVPQTVVNAKVILEGAFDTTTTSMSTRLLGVLPTAQPYNTPPWNYAGNGHEIVYGGLPSGDIVDWVLVELRIGTAASTKIGTRAAFLLRNGSIVDMNGSSQVNFGPDYLGSRSVDPGSYYVVVRHRNHLPVMSAGPVAISANSSALYDFTTAQTKAYGTNPMKLLPRGSVYGMYVGDANGDGSVTISDRVLWKTQNGGSPGYLSADFNLSGDVTISDRVLWKSNNGSGTQVP